MRSDRLVLLGVLLALSTATAARKPVPAPKIASGIYSNVTESKETGDRGGIEIRLFAEAEKPYVEAVACESECNGEGRYYVRQTEKGFAFTWKNPRFKEDDPITFQVWKSGRTIWIEGMEGRWMRGRLKPVKEPLGLYGYND